MDIALWIVAGTLAVAFLAAGTSKVVSGWRIVDRGQRWARHFSDAGIRSIGVAEILGAIGVIMPA